MDTSTQATRTVGPLEPMQAALDILMTEGASPSEIERAKGLTVLARELRIAKGKSVRAYGDLNQVILPPAPAPIGAGEPVGTHQHHIDSHDVTETLGSGLYAGEGEPSITREHMSSEGSSVN